MIQFLANLNFVTLAGLTLAALAFSASILTGIFAVYNFIVTRKAIRAYEAMPKASPPSLSQPGTNRWNRIHGRDPEPTRVGHESPAAPGLGITMLWATPPSRRGPGMTQVMPIAAPAETTSKGTVIIRPSDAAPAPAYFTPTQAINVASVSRRTALGIGPVPPAPPQRRTLLGMIFNRPQVTPEVPRQEPMAPVKAEPTPTPVKAERKTFMDEVGALLARVTVRGLAPNQPVSVVIPAKPRPKTNRRAELLKGLEVNHGRPCILLASEIQSLSSLGELVATDHGGRPLHSTGKLERAVRNGYRVLILIDEFSAATNWWEDYLNLDPEDDTRDIVISLEDFPGTRDVRRLAAWRTAYELLGALLPNRVTWQYLRDNAPRFSIARPDTIHVFNTRAA